MIPEKTFYAVSDSAHFFGALSAVLLLAHFHFAIYWAILGIALAALKEFWYDERYESTEVRGSGLRDFIGYILGGAIGMIVICI